MKDTRAHKEAQEFNSRVKVGQEVFYKEHSLSAPKKYKISYQAYVAGGHTAVTHLEGKAGCVACSHCSVLDGG